MSFGRLFILAAAALLAIPSLAATKKRVHVVTGPSSGRTQVNMHPMDQKMVINVVYKGCDPNPKSDHVYFKPSETTCLKDRNVPERFTGNTLQMVFRYKERNRDGSPRFNQNCPDSELKTTRFTLASTLDPNKIPDTPANQRRLKTARAYQKAVKDCQAVNISVQGESDTKEILGQKLKKAHQRFNTHNLNSPQACNNLDKYKKFNFEDLAPKKDPKFKSGLYFRNGGFRLGNHTYFEYNKKAGNWCRKTYQGDEIEKIGNRLLTRDKVISDGICGVNGDPNDMSSKPLPLPEVRNGEIYLRGSISLLSDGRSLIAPINKSTGIKYNDIKLQAAAEATGLTVNDFRKNTAAAQQAKKKGDFRKKYFSKLRKVFSEKMKKISSDLLKNYDKTKGSIVMKVEEDKHGLRKSMISAYDKDRKHLRSVEINPSNVVGSLLDSKNSWCGGENCISSSLKRNPKCVRKALQEKTNPEDCDLLPGGSRAADSYIFAQLGLDSRARAFQVEIDKGATCRENSAKGLNLSGGNNVCMSCFGITPGQCDTKKVGIDNGFAVGGDPKDSVLGKHDPIEKLVKSRYKETKGQTCQRTAAPEPTNKVEIFSSRPVQPEIIEI